MKIAGNCAQCLGPIHVPKHFSARRCAARKFCSHACYLASEPHKRREYKTTPPEVRLWQFISPEPNSGCWLWTSGKVNGYAVLTTNGRPWYVHRYMCSTANGPPTKDRNVARHLCHNSLCVNPHHLAWGDNADNSKDTVSVGRHAFGDRHGNSKIAFEQIVEMRNLYRSGLNIRDLAYQFGLHHQYVYALCSERRRKSA